MIDAEILPTLLALAIDEDRGDPLRAAAMLSAARLGSAGLQLDRVGRMQRQALVLKVLQAGLLDNSRDVQEAATLGLALTGGSSSLPVLAGIALDTEVGRMAVGEERVPLRFRALASYGLGLAAQRATHPAMVAYAGHQLEAVLAEGDAKHADLGTAAILALGLIPPAGLGPDGDPVDARLQALGLMLLDKLEDPRAHRAQRVRIPTALGRMAAGFDSQLRRQVVVELTRALKDSSKLPQGAVRSAALALGQLGDADADEEDKLIRKSLEAALKSKDGMVRRYSALSLARVGSRAGENPDAPFAHAQAVADILGRQLTHSRSSDEAWNALALGVFAYHLHARGESSYGVDRMLTSALSTSKSADRAPAFSLAAGMADAQGASGMILKRLAHLGDDQAAGMLSVALGLSGDQKVLPRLQEVSLESHNRPERKIDLALGRAALGDTGLVPELLEQMAECDCWASTRGSVRSLARVGDIRAVAPLLRLARDQRRDDRQRTEAVEALGWIAAGDTAPWNDPLVVALDPIEAPDTLTEPTGYGVLDRE